MSKKSVHKAPPNHTGGIKNPETMPKPRLKYYLLLTAFAMLLFMTTFEVAKDLLNPGLSVWGSHFITILFTSLLATIITYFVFKRINHQNQKLNEEIIMRKNAEIRLEGFENRSLAWLEYSPVCTKMVDLDFNLQYMSAAGINGLNIDDITQFYGKPYPFDFYPESFRNLMIGNLEKVKETGGIIEQEGSVVDINGDELWFHSTLVPVNDERGQIDYIIVVSIETTKRKQAEEALRESEKKYRSLFENAVEGFFQSAPEGRFISVNPAFAEMLGYSSPEELISNITDIASQFYVNSEDRIQYQKSLRESGKVENYEYLARRKNGSPIWVSNSTRAHFDKDGKVIRYEGTVQDITERKRTEETLREREEQYRAVVENIGDSIMRYDRNFKHIYGNRNALEDVGLTADQYIGKTHREMGFPGHLCELWEKNIQLVFNTGEKQSVEFDVELAEGPRSLELKLNPEFETDGSVKTVIGISRDVTERKQVEAEKRNLESRLLQAQKMEAIGTLAGGIAHDFNNILSPLVGFTEMLQEDLPQDSSHQEHVAEVLQAAMRAKELVKQILAFSRQSDTELKPVKLQSILEEALKLLRSSIPRTIDIQTDLDPDCGLVIADPTQFHQIIMNLATNAYHAMRESRGRLKIVLNQKRVESNPLGFSGLLPGRYAVLKVIDSGTGIRKDILDKIFDPYFTTKESDKGTGLGLSVVQGIVKSFKGDIHVYSEPGKGTEVHVYLPIMEKTMSNGKQDLLQPIPGGIERILLVDDEKAIVKMEQQVLERLGYHVTSQTNSIEALETFKKNPDQYDLIISDMTMPNITGVQLANEVKEVRSDIPVIICTGFSEQINEETCREFGIQGYLAKPVIKREIAQTIRDVLDRLGKT